MIQQILPVVEIVFHNVVYYSADECDVGSGPESHIQVGSGRGTGETGIHAYEFGPFIHSFGYPSEGDGMIFRSIGSDDHNAVRIFDIDPVIGHSPSAVRFRQTGDGGGMSYTGLMF